MSPDYSGAITVMRKDGDHCAEAIGPVREILQGLADGGHALSEMLRRIAEAHGSLVGFLWTIDQRAGILRLTESWYSPAAPAATTFIETNKTLTFARGRGLPGRLWASGNASWVTSIGEDADFPRAASAAAAGLRCAFGFPILTEKGIGGVVEFFGTAPSGPPPGAGELLRSLGLHVGALMQRIEAEEALRNSEELLRKTAEELGEVFWCWDPARQRLLYVNGAYETIWGRSHESLLQKPDSFLEAVHPDDRARVFAYLDRQRQGARAEEEYRILRRDGSIRWIRDRTFAIRNRKGEIERIAGIATDTTSRKRLEEQIRQAQKHEALGFLVGGLAHDFNNLLTAIMGNASLAIGELDRRHPARELMNQIVGSAERAAKLIQQMLAYAGKGRRAIKGVDISQVVASALESVEFRPRIQVSKRLASELPRINADPGRIRQLTENLLWNAIEAIGNDAGEITVATGVRVMGATDQDARPLDELKPGTYLFIEVSDNGCGMDESTKAKIFDPFFTTKFMGRGLGLSAVLGIVRANHGAIRVFSSPGRCSVFTVLLPASSNPEERMHA